MNGAKEQTVGILTILKMPKREGRHLMHQPMDIGQNIDIGIILTAVFTTMIIENYISTLKGRIGGFPHHCRMP